MTIKVHNSSWSALLAPIAWLAAKMLEKIFGSYWNRSKNIPYSNGQADQENVQE